MVPLELPEIDTYRRDLEREMLGRKIKDVDVKSMKVLPYHKSKKAVAEAAVGAKINSVERRGMQLLLPLSNEHTMVITLGTTGRLLKPASKSGDNGAVQVVIAFTQGGDLQLIDELESDDEASSLAFVDNENLDAVLVPRSELGFDLLTKPVTWMEFRHWVLTRDDKLKAMLTDHTSFVGIADIYSDEILFDAGLRYDRPCSSLTTQEVRRLYQSIAGVMHDAIKYRGTSLEKRPFADLLGQPGEFADHLSVYGRDGGLSPRSRKPIRKATFQKKPVYFCDTQV